MCSYFMNILQIQDVINKYQDWGFCTSIIICLRWTLPNESVIENTVYSCIFS